MSLTKINHPGSNSMANKNLLLDYFISWRGLVRTENYLLFLVCVIIAKVRSEILILCSADELCKQSYK